MFNFQIYFIRFLLLSIIAVQLWFLSTQPLFGDESFYWLESQHLDWSYAELPGWTAWMIRIGTEVFGSNYFAVRIISFISYLSIFYAFFRLNKKLKISNSSINLLLIVSVPIYLLIATMALPDIWMLFFASWISYFIYKASVEKQTKNWVVLGLLVACSLNVHVRMWIWVFIAALCYLWVFRASSKLLMPLLFISLPISLLGLLPVIIFNFENEFALIKFQFMERQPWQFQIQNLSFIASQFIVITPLVLFIWARLVMQFRDSNSYLKWLLMTSLIHALFFMVMSLFADGLRTTVHWLLISYLPILGIATHKFRNIAVIKLAIITGFLMTLIFIYYLSFSESNTKSRIVNNSTQWPSLAVAVEKAKGDFKARHVIADYFMTASEIGFELDDISSTKVLPHKKNKKHGRQLQLKIMNLLLEDDDQIIEPSILVVEDSALKLQDKGDYYLKLCQRFDGMTHIDSVSDPISIKQYHLFLLNEEKQCQIPAIFYIDHQNGSDLEISGWVVYHNFGIKNLYIVTTDQEISISNNQLPIHGITKHFPFDFDPKIPNIGFKVKISNKIDSFRIKATGLDGKEFYSSLYYLK